MGLARSTAGRSRSAARTSPSAAARAGAATAARAARAASSKTSRTIPHSAGQSDRRRRRHASPRPSKRGYTVFPGVHGFERSVELLGNVPVVCAVMGTAAGGPAGRAILSHWSVMVKGTSQIFAAGPPVVERSLGEKITKEELGGAAGRGRHRRHDRQRRRRRARVLRRRSGASCRYMPQNVWELPPVAAHATIRPIAATTRCCRIVPRDRRQPYNMRKLIELVVDRGSLFEIQPTFGKRAHHLRSRAWTARSSASSPTIRWSTAARWTCKAARKQTHFIELCDMLPHPARLLRRRARASWSAREAEAAATLREGMRARLRRPAGDRADVHRGRSASATAWPAWARPTRTGSTSRSPGRPPNGARCRSKAASPRRSGARSPARADPKARETRNRGRAARARLAVPHRRGVRRRGHHRSARDAALSVPVHRCRAGAARAPPSDQSQNMACVHEHANKTAEGMMMKFRLLDRASVGVSRRLARSGGSPQRRTRSKVRFGILTTASQAAFYCRRPSGHLRQVRLRRGGDCRSRPACRPIRRWPPARWTGRAAASNRPSSPGPTGCRSRPMRCTPRAAIPTASSCARKPTSIRAKDLSGKKRRRAAGHRAGAGAEPGHPEGRPAARRRQARQCHLRQHGPDAGRRARSMRWSASSRS